MAFSDNKSSIIVKLFQLLLELCSPDVLAGLAATAVGMVGGGVTAVAITSATTTTGPIANGAGAVALGGGATARALKLGWALAIGAGASAHAVGGVAVDIAPAVLAGIVVGGLIGLLVYLVGKSFILSGKNKTA